MKYILRTIAVILFAIVSIAFFDLVFNGSNSKDYWLEFFVFLALVGCTASIVVVVFKVLK